MGRKNQRSILNFLVLPKFQLLFIILNLVSSLFLSVFLCVTFYVVSRSNYKILVDLSPMTDEARALVYRDLYITIVLMIVLSFLFCIITCLISAALSHRAAGPIYKTIQTLKRMADSDELYEFALRPNDEFQELVPLINRVIKKLKSQNKENLE